MDGMDHDMGHMTPPPSSMNASTPHPKMMMHMSFFWGTATEILFSKWPGTNTGMYYVAVLFVFALAVAVEWLSHCRISKAGSGHVAAGIVQTVLHCLRVGLGYMVMLALMSFNGGVFLVAVSGHTLGFFLFGSSFFKKSVEVNDKESGLPPMTC